jgi:hypothetical protein
MVRARIRPLDLSLHQASSDHSLRGTWPLRGCRSPRSSSPWVVAIRGGVSPQSSSPWVVASPRWRLTPIILPLGRGLFHWTTVLPLGSWLPPSLYFSSPCPLHGPEFSAAGYHLHTGACGLGTVFAKLRQCPSVTKLSDRDPSSPPPLEPGSPP